MEHKIKKLVIAKHLIIKSFADIAYNEDYKDDEHFLKFWAECFGVLSEILNLEVNSRNLNIGDFDFDRIISSYLKSSIENDLLFEKIQDNFGLELAYYYLFLTHLVAMQYLSSFYLHENILKNIPAKRKKIILSELKYGDHFAKIYLENFKINNRVLIKYLPTDIILMLKKIDEEDVNSKIDYIKIHEVLSEVINSLFPDYSEIDFNMNIAYEIANNIEKCEKGMAGWAEFEKNGIKALRFLLFPEFDTFYFQQRTENGHQIRDVVIPNTQNFGFWNYLKHELDSKNIVVEFKNGIEKSAEKNSLNQLRIYLSKKTIGRFGFLFVRNAPSKSLLTAQRLAYEESGILILIIDDKLLKKLCE